MSGVSAGEDVVDLQRQALALAVEALAIAGRMEVLLQKAGALSDHVASLTVKSGASGWRASLKITEAIDAVSQLTGVSKALILSDNRETPVVMARFLVVGRARRAGLSQPQIARDLGQRDPSTIGHAEKSVGRARAYWINFGIAEDHINRVLTP